jgi:glucokinase
MTGYAIGVDLGGTNVKLAAVTGAGEVLRRAQVPTDDRTGAWGERIRDGILAAEAALGGPAERVGVSAPGLAARDGRRIAWMQGRLDAIQGLDWTEFLALRRAVPVLNDAHAALLGEAWLGAAAGCPNVMLLTLGTGVGGAAIVDGRLLRGHLGRAGHLGHLCLDPDGPPDIVGTPGSLEAAIGSCSLAARSGGRFTSTRALVEAHLAGDGEAGRVWLRSVYLLACGIVSLSNALDPEVVVLGGGISRAGPALFDPLQEYLDRLEWRPVGTGVRLRAAELGEFAGAIGAARHALTADGEALP